MVISDILKDLSEATGISGVEEEAVRVANGFLNPYVDSLKIDVSGNLVALKKGNQEIADNKSGQKDFSGIKKYKRPSVFLAAHIDEIGLMVTKVDKKGFIRFTTVGGFDPRTLPGQEVKVHSKKILQGVIGSTPPHLLSAKEIKKEARTDEMFIDIGLSAKKAKELVNVGDPISIQRDFIKMKDSEYMSGKALDNRVGVAVLIYAANELSRVKHLADIYFTGTVQEEVGTRGAITSAYSVMPDLGIAVDVCHGDMPGVNTEDTFELGKGPSIAIGPNIHPVLGDALQKTAAQYRIPFNIDPEPGPTPTDARAIQVTREGVPCALLSIPLRYMHTSVEMVHGADIRYAGRLLAKFIAGIDDDFISQINDYD